MERLYSIEEVCQIVPGMTRGKLAQRRFQGLPPAWVAPSPKTICYPESAITKWLDESVQTQTGQAVSA